jgi:asparagine synthase (glutamine-hydrolysing)
MPRDRATQDLQRMIASMHHESFYVTGTWVDEKLGLYAGWVGRKDSCTPGMPLGDSSGTRTLLFSGEHYSDPAVASPLARPSDSTRGAHLLGLAEDSAFPENLNGQFQGVIADHASQTVTLFNDRFGLRRIYYHRANDAFYFAAEAKAILEVRPKLREIDMQSMGEYVACGCVLEDRTLFRNIYLLPCASAWIFRDAKLHRKSTYFERTKWEEQTPLEPGPYYEEVRDTFAQNLPRYFSSPQNIGMSLTGGLDTRMILAWRKPPPHSLSCYTFASNYRECHDVRIARQVAQICQQEHQSIRVDHDFVSRFDHYAERTVYLTDGCVGVQQSPDLYVNEIARSIAPIRMTGNYGDQVLRHLTVFRPSAASSGVFTDDFLHHAGAASETYANSMRGHPLTVATTVQTAWKYFGLYALESSQLLMRSPFLDNDLMRVLYRSPPSSLTNNDLRVQLVHDGDPVLSAIRTDLGFAGRGGRAVSKMSQFLHRLSMRIEYATEHGDPPWFAQFDNNILGGQIEKSFIGRHKFTHFALWYRGVLADYLREMLLDPRTLCRPYLRPGAVQKLLAGQLRKGTNFTPAIHQVLTLEYLHRLFIDGRPDT